MRSIAKLPLASLKRQRALLASASPTPSRSSAVVKETLRLHPPQWLLARTAMQATQLGGFDVAPETTVLTCPYLLHRDERWWERLEEFAPERWLSTTRPHAPRAYLPFGAGPRFCPGSLLGSVQLVTLAALVARDYRLELPRLADVETAADSLLTPARLTGTWR